MREEDIVGEIRQIETIAKGMGVHIRQYLNQKYGRGRWRKLKGRALVKDVHGEPKRAEIHWFEAHGLGRKDFKVKQWLE